MAEDKLEKKKCPNCGAIAMFESSGITICGACGEFGGPAIHEFEKVLDNNIAAAEAAKLKQEAQEQVDEQKEEQQK